jgi:hypothetical protein
MTQGSYQSAVGVPYDFSLRKPQRHGIGLANPSSIAIPQVTNVTAMTQLTIMQK